MKLSRENRMLRLAGLTAMGVALGLLAQAILGPPETTTTQKPRRFSEPLRVPEALSSENAGSSESP